MFGSSVILPPHSGQFPQGGTILLESSDYIQVFHAEPILFDEQVLNPRLSDLLSSHLHPGPGIRSYVAWSCSSELCARITSNHFLKRGLKNPANSGFIISKNGTMGRKYAGARLFPHPTLNASLLIPQDSVLPCQSGL